MASEPERIVLTYQDLEDLPEDRNRYETLQRHFDRAEYPSPRVGDSSGIGHWCFSRPYLISS